MYGINLVVIVTRRVGKCNANLYIGNIGVSDVWSDYLDGQ